MRLRSLLLPGLAAAVVAIAGLGFAHGHPAASGGMTSAVITGKTATIKISNYMYAPMALTVRSGTEIMVINTDQTAHTLTAQAGAFDTGTIAPGKSVHFIVTKPGVYSFYCQFHAFMTGTIKVIK